MNQYIIANWKANQNRQQTYEFIRQFLALTATSPLPQDLQLVVCPPAVFYLEFVGKSLPLAAGLQDISVFAGGAYTGELTAQNLTGIEPAFVIVGHSERRREFGETNELIVRKCEQVWSLGATPIVCFDEPEAASLSQLLQVHAGKSMILAYEPVSAISTSGSAGNLDPQALNQQLVGFRQLFPGMPIIYGGSVKPENAGSYAGICDGLLVGSASLKAESFVGIARNFAHQ
ncbi:triosephosphate isomerase [bacterium]|nr:triosephosphate isomerase [bacterium]